MLTKRQQQVLTFIQSTQEREGIPPSSREIQEHFGFASQTAAMNHLRALERHGAVRRRPGKARAVAVIPSIKRERIVDVPIYGQIAAGFAGMTEQESLGTVSIDTATAGVSKRARLFGLKVRGDSMIGAHIDDGDLVILEARPAHHGDIVAALIDGETTLKRFVMERGRSFLRAENPDYPEFYPTEELIVQGVMVALIRRTRRPDRRSS